MPDNPNIPLDPADPPETQPPGTSTQTESDPLADFNVADPPETQPPNT